MTAPNCANIEGDAAMTEKALLNCKLGIATLAFYIGQCRAGTYAKVFKYERK
jgi:hypothetical protein